MQPDVATDFQWGRRFLPHMKQIIGHHLIAEASPDEDAHHNTDLIVLRLDAVRIACRARRDGYRRRYGHQFTIRTDRPSGVKTELAKVIEGWGDYILYGFGDDRSDNLTAWALGDLRVFRLWFMRQTTLLRPREMPGEKCPNRDGTWFRAFAYADLPDEFLVASHNLPGPVAVAA